MLTLPPGIAAFQSEQDAAAEQERRTQDVQEVHHPVLQKHSTWTLATLFDYVHVI